MTPRAYRYAQLTVAVLAASLLATGCGVSLEYSRERMIDDLTEESVLFLEGLPQARAITSEEKDCFRKEFGRFSTTDLKTIHTAGSEGDIFGPPRLQERVVSLLVACADAGGS